MAEPSGLKRKVPEVMRAMTSSVVPRVATAPPPLEA